MYTGPTLRYPLTTSECAKLSDVWRFITTFRFLTVSLHDYRTRIINSIRRDYTPESFYELEMIAEKLFWNLRHRTCTTFLDGQDPGDDLCHLTGLDHHRGGTIPQALETMYKDPSYRSFINKLILVDDVHNRVYYRRQEGSAPILAKNAFNLSTAWVFYDRDRYEAVMADPSTILSHSPPAYYHQYDYAFPNLNYGKPFIQTRAFRTKRIANMYFTGDVEDSEKNWFRLQEP